MAETQNHTTNLGEIKSIKEVFDFKIQPIASMNGKGGRLGMSQMTNALCGYAAMDGYKVETDKHIIYVLIDNGQSCCESWGYFSSDDDLSLFTGSELKEINLTDKALNKQKFKDSDYYEDEGGIQFVDFVTNKGIFQLAVYNAHNGYYGHGILVAKDDEIILNETL
jgi:hypothetical protein